MDPARPGSGRSTAPPSGPGAVTSDARVVASSSTTATPASAGWPRSHRLASSWSRRGTAERADDGDAGRAAADRLEQRELGVGLVLRDGRAQDLDAVGRGGLDEGRLQRVEVAHQDRRHEPDRQGPGVPAVGRDDRPRQPSSQPGQAASRAARVGTSPSATTSA